VAESSDQLQELADIAELNLDQVLFMKNTAILVRQKRKSTRFMSLKESVELIRRLTGDMITKVREAKAFANDYYFISQLYDENWTPSPIA
jgi:hypothetical protein